MSCEPRQIRAGDTLKWTRSLANYPASEWTLKYSLRNASEKIDLDSEEISADGDTYSITVPADDTKDWKPGRYSVVGYVINDSERYTVFTGDLNVLPDLTGDSPIDARSHNRKMLDAIMATLEGRATSDVEEYTIYGRSMKKMSVSELEDQRLRYEYAVAEEEGRAKRMMGVSFGRCI